MATAHPTIQEPASVSLRALLAILFKRKISIILIFLATVGTVTSATLLMPPTYEATSSLLVKFGREFVYRPEVGEKPPMITFNQEEVINSAISIITSRDIIEQVIQAITLEKLYPQIASKPPAQAKPLETAVMVFQKKLSAVGIKKSSVIRVSFQHEDPQLAAQSVNLLIEYFKEKHLEIHGGTESDFLENQLQFHELELKWSEDRLENFKQENRIYSLEEQRSLLLRQRNELDSSLKSTRNQIDEMTNRLAAFRQQMMAILADKDLYTHTERDRIIVEARAKLLNLQLDEQSLASKYTDDNRLLANTRKEIEIIQAFLQEQETAIGGKVKTANPAYQEAEKEANRAAAEEQALRARAGTLKVQIDQLDSEIQLMDLRERDLKELRREVATHEKNFQIYQDKMEESRILDEMNRQKMANISVIQAAVAPAKPIKPKKKLNVLLGMILGAASGLSFAFFSEFSNQSFTSPDSVEKRLGLPVIATIPLIPRSVGPFQPDH